MYKQLKAEIREIIDIVNQCPDSLKEKCFELLLNDYLTNGRQELLGGEMRNPSAVATNSGSFAVEASTDEVKSTLGATNDDISEKDFHVKTQKFLKENAITMNCLNDLYYKENGQLRPFYESLKTTSMAECQLRLALLTAFENSFVSSSPDMTFNCEVIRERCQAMKCYNATNFATNFKSNKELWETWPDKYDKEFIVTLSTAGKKRLAEVLLDLAEV